MTNETLVCMRKIAHGTKLVHNIKNKYLREKINSLVTWKNILYLVCSIGCFLQIYNITSRYLEYEVSTHISMTISHKLEIFDMVLCVETRRFLDFSKLRNNHPDLTRDMLNDCGLPLNTTDITLVKDEKLEYYVYNNLKVREVYNVLYPTNYLILRIISQRSKVNETTGNLKHDPLCLLEPVFKDYGICYIASCKNQSQKRQSEIHDHFARPKLQPGFAIDLNQSFIFDKQLPNLYVVAVDSGTLPRGDQLKFKTVRFLNTSQKYSFTYKYFVQTLLPHPCPTDCFDYRKNNWESREHLRESCLDNSSLTIFNTTFHETVTSALKDHYFGKRSYELCKKNESARKKAIDFIIACEEKSKKPACNQRNIILESTNPEPMKTTFSRIEVKKPVQPNIAITYRRKMHLIDYFVYIGSILGTWFGFSVSLFLPMISKLIEKRIRKHEDSQRKERNPLRSKRINEFLSARHIIEKWDTIRLRDILNPIQDSSTIRT